MDLYRLIHRPPPPCTSHQYLQKILMAGQPPIHVNQVSVTDSQRREERVFYPDKALRNIIQKDDVKLLLTCPCDRCRNARKNLTAIELPKRVDQIVDEPSPSTLLLAILVFLEHSFLIRELVFNHQVNDLSLHKVPTRLESRKGLLERGFWDHQEQQTIDEFCHTYTSALALFDVPTFQDKGPFYEYTDECRFPFLDEEFHDSGSLGRFGSSTSMKIILITRSKVRLVTQSRVK